MWLASNMRILCATLLFASVAQGFQFRSHDVKFPQTRNIVKKYPNAPAVETCGLDPSAPFQRWSTVEDKDGHEADKARKFIGIQNFGEILSVTKLIRARSISCPRLRRAVGLALASTAITLSPFVTPKAVHASAPVMALPKAEGRDPVTEALGHHQRKQSAQQQRELTEMAATARRIEAEQGEGARLQYEQDYQRDKENAAKEKAVAVDQLKRDLLNQGICPFIDLEGQRQVILLQKGIDLGKIQGTQFNLQKVWEQKQPQRSDYVKKATHRSVLRCMVQDMIKRNVDPLEYFESHQDQTEAILALSPEAAARLLQQYEQNMGEHGHITGPTPGATAAAVASIPLSAASKSATKTASRDKAAEVKASIKAKKRALKDRAKVAKQQAKQAAKAAKVAARAAKKKAKSAMHVTKDTVLRAVHQEEDEIADADITETPTDDTVSLPVLDAKDTSQSNLNIPAVAGAATVVGLGGTFALNVYKKNVAATEEDRQRQLELLLGTGTKDDPRTTKALEEIDTDLMQIDEPTNFPSVPPATALPKKKRLGGLKGVFGSKKNQRETDLSRLVAPEAVAPDFTTTLAKILTFGAPGRFPAVTALPGGMPFDAFDLTIAQESLRRAQTDAGLSLEDSAEVFANVVNCMLVDIVDLASVSLKEKEEAVLVDGISVLVDFMNHAASLYDSIAKGVTIKPVTYGGTLSKSKLEQMYGTYASAGMLNMGSSMDENFDDRVAMLRDVFVISEKKAEGIIMKVMQKNMAEMMKDPESMKAMGEMMGGMEGMEGMEGLANSAGPDGEGPDPEQLKEMLTSLKQIKDSGSLPASEFEEVKKQFTEAFGHSMDDVIRDANENNEQLSQTDKELLELVKSIMED